MNRNLIFALVLHLLILPSAHAFPSSAAPMNGRGGRELRSLPRQHRPTHALRMVGGAAALSPTMAAFARIAPLLGVIVGNIQCATPIIPVMAARRSGKIGELNTLVYVALVANNLGWLLYGWTLKDWWIFGTSISQCSMALFYAISCHPYSPPDVQRQVLIFSSLYASVFALAAGSLFLYPNNFGGATGVWGVVAQTCCIAYYSSPLTVLKKVIKSRDSASIDPLLTLVSMFHAGMWVIYGSGMSDFWLLLSSSIGCSLQVVFMLVWLTFRKGSRFAANTRAHS